MPPEQIANPGPSSSWVRTALALARGPRAARAAQAFAVGGAVVEVGRAAHRRVRDRVAYTVTLPASDDTYDDVHAWLLESLSPRRRRSVVVRSTSNRHGLVVAPEPGRLGPRPGLRQFYDGSAVTVRVDGHRVVARVEREHFGANVTLSASDSTWFRPLEQMVFTAYGHAARDALVRHLEGFAARLAEDPAPRFYIATRWGDWRRLTDLPTRPLDTVILRAGQREEVVEDLARFLASEHLYARVGLPWHRGYLLHGPPGTGKTSLARALAQHFRLDVRYVPLSDLTADSNLLQLLGMVDSRSMLVLEDVDVVHASHSRDDAESTGISLSGLLNALDGLTTPHGLVTVMTTNDADALDPALVRPGRADRRVELGPLDDDQLARLAALLLGDDPFLAGYVDGLDGREVAHAELVEAAKPHLGDPHAIRLALKEFLR